VKPVYPNSPSFGGAASWVSSIIAILQTSFGAVTARR
jgi:hypothetical protein